MTTTTAPTSSAPATLEGPTRHRGRSLASLVLLVLGMVLTPITILTLWVTTQVSDTDRYIQTIMPLAEDPAVQAYVADEVTTRLFSQVDVEEYVRGVLPPRAQVLARPITSAVESSTRQAIMQVLASDRFQQVWHDANRLAHEQLVEILTDDGNDAVKVSSKGEVTVDLSALGANIKQQIADYGITAFANLPTDRVSGTVVLFESKNLYQARSAFGLLTKVSFVLPFVVLGCFVGSVLLASKRRRGVVRAAVAFALGAISLAALLRFGRGLYLDATDAGGVPHDAATAAYDTLLRALQTSVRAVLSFSLIVVIALIAGGQSRLAVGFRNKTRDVIGWLDRQCAEAGWTWLGASELVRQRRTALRVAATIAGFFVLFFWDRPTPLVVFSIACGVVALLALVEFFGREPGHRGADEGQFIPTG